LLTLGRDLPSPARSIVRAGIFVRGKHIAGGGWRFPKTRYVQRGPKTWPADPCGASPGRGVRRGPAALLLLAIALAPSTAMAQAAPQPVFTELFAYDPGASSQLLGKWLISSRLDSKVQPLRVGVVEDRAGKTVGRVTVQDGDGLDGANEAM